MVIQKDRQDVIEAMSCEELELKVERHLIEKQLKRLASYNSFYSKIWTDSGYNKNDLEDFNNFKYLPIIGKNQILEDQEKYPPYGQICRDIQKTKFRRVHVTSGSTGKPVYILLGEEDINDTITAGKRAFNCAGLTSKDVVIHCLNYCLWSGGISDHMCMEATGATVIPYGVGNSRKLINTIKDLKPSVISCTPSYLLRLETILKEEYGMLPYELGIKKALLGGEGGLQVGEFRGNIERKWEMDAIDANYGMADVLSIFGSECHTRTGLHFHGQGIVKLELIDPSNSKTVELCKGAVGELVLTNLTRQVQPMVRYRTGDIIEIVSTDTCECGRKSLRFMVKGRSDEMIVVKGINVFPNSVAQLLQKNPEWFSGEFKLVVKEPLPIRTLILKVEITKKAVKNRVEITNYLSSMCKDILTFSPIIELVNYGGFPRNEGKTKRVYWQYNEDK